jgi:hypothetical protein
MVTAEFDHRLEEHLRAARVYYRARSWFARGDKVVASVMAVMGVALVAAVGLQWWAVIWLVVAPLEWFHLITIEPLTVRYVFKRSARFHEHTTLAFSEAHIHYKTPSIDSTLDWALFSGLIEDDELFLLPYKAPRAYAIIPKRAFDSEWARAEFRELAQNKLAKVAA